MRLVIFGLLLLRLIPDFIRQWIPGQQRHKPTHPREILVLHHLLLGDAIMITPLLAKLREQYPDSRISLALPKAFTDLYVHHPFGVEAIPFDPRDLATFWSLVKRPRPDWVILPADNRYSWLARSLGAGWITGFAGDKPDHKNWLVDELRPYSTVPTAWGDTSAELVDGPLPAPYCAEAWQPPPYKPFDLPAKPYAILHVGASNYLRHWPAENWLKTAAWLHNKGITPVWSAGHNEIALVNSIDPEHQYPSYAGLLSLPQLWQLLANAELLIVPDTGVAHLARLAETPTFCLYGPGCSVAFGPGNYWKNSRYYPITEKDIPCRDQHIQFFRHVEWLNRCERLPPACTKPLCMQAITVDQLTISISKHQKFRQHAT